MTFKFVVLLLVFARSIEGAGLQVAFQWKYIDWFGRAVELTGNKFIPGNAFTQDVDVDKFGRVFVTSPRWLEGVPIVLSLITNVQGPGGPLLVPYPDFSWHVFSDCDSLISVYRIAIDECDRLWVVDTGRIKGKAVCPTKILIFDLNTDRLIHKYVVPDQQTFNGKAALVTPIVEIGKNCLDTFLYMADVDQNGLVVYDLFHDISWRVNNTRGNAFGPDDDAMGITIAGESFNLTDGTLGMSLSPAGFYEQRYLYFNSLASYHEKFTDVRYLKEGLYREPLIFRSTYKLPSQAGVQATSAKGVIFFQLVEYTALACWNIEKPLISENIVIVMQDEEALQYVSGIKVIVNANGEEEIWFNTNRLQKTINMTLKPTEINFRVIKGKVDDLIRGTNCEPDIFYSRKAPDVTFFHQI